MIVEINFLEEKKKKNIVPYLLVAVFIGLIVVSGVWMYRQYDVYQQQQSALQNELNANRQFQQEHEGRTNLAQKRQLLSEQVTQLQEETFPSVPLLKRLITLLPKTGYFDSYTFSLDGDISLILRVNTLEQIAAYSKTLEQQSFVENVNVSNINVNTANENRTYIASFQVTIDEQQWVKEVDAE